MPEIEVITYIPTWYALREDSLQKKYKARKNDRKAAYC